MPLAAVAQYCGTANVAANIEICFKLMRDAVVKGAQMVFFPEASDFIATTTKETIELTKAHSRSFVEDIKKEARNQKLWVSIGVHEQSLSPNKIYNTHLIISDDGIEIGKYRKLHLFDVDIKDGPVILESTSTDYGEQVISPISTPLGKVGMSVCYDLRFPELSTELRKRGADILTAHIGKHNDKRASYGNAMIVDSWGTVLARCPETIKPSLAFADIDLDRLHQVRREMPIMDHRRVDIFTHLAS
ncbi:7425_t:CDS:2 [Paraglomus occultum]|uniref:7425_t:CDS:1 n=1 Tax=Paraglomus occultum TaxID=144539 RepID=A0A9N8WJ45_9GLOM|nr:7425_t:CDS:2 [Paraglomus occultum]